MKINIKASHMDVNEAAKKYIDDKIGSTEKFLGKVPAINCDVEVDKSVGGQNKGEIYRAEVNLQVPQEILRVEKTGTDLFKAIDKVKDHLAIVIKKYKEKLIDKRRKK